MRNYSKPWIYSLASMGNLSTTVTSPFAIWGRFTRPAGISPGEGKRGSTGRLDHRPAQRQGGAQSHGQLLHARLHRQIYRRTNGRAGTTFSAGKRFRRKEKGRVYPGGQSAGPLDGQWTLPGRGHRVYSALHRRERVP